MLSGGTLVSASGIDSVRSDVTAILSPGPSAVAPSPTSPNNSLAFSQSKWIRTRYRYVTLASKSLTSTVVNDFGSGFSFKVIDCVVVQPAWEAFDCRLY